MSGLTFILLGVYTLFLVSSEKILFFIHPRFVSLSTITGFFLIVIGILLVIMTIDNFKKSMLKKQFLLSIFKRHGVFLIIGILITILPVQTLGSATAKQRVTDYNNVADTNIVTLFALNNSNQFNLKEWVLLINSTPKYETLIGKKISVSGFIFADSRYSEDYFTITRFRIACCAIDASPIGLPVKYDWKSKFTEDTWVHIDGIFSIEIVDGEQKLIIIPSDVYKIDVPSNPYVY